MEVDLSEIEFLLIFETCGADICEIWITSNGLGSSDEGDKYLLVR